MNNLKFELYHRYLINIGTHTNLEECRVVEISKEGRIKLAVKTSSDEEYFDWFDVDENYTIIEDLGIATESRIE